MGKLITFWSPVSGQAKVTSCLCAVVSSLGLRYPQLDIAVSAIGNGGRTLESKLYDRSGSKNVTELYERSGVSALILSYKQGNLAKEGIRRCALPLLFSSVSLFPGLSKEVNVIHGKEFERLEYHVLVEKLTGEHEITCLDLKNGIHDNSFRYMEAADLVVIVMPQNPAVWENFQKECKARLIGKNVYVLFGGYLKHARYGMAQYKRYFFRNGDGRIGAIPMNTGYMDALSEGRTMEFFLKNENVRKREENYEFMEYTEKATEQIRTHIFLP